MALDKHLIPQFRFDSHRTDLKYGEELVLEVSTKWGPAEVVLLQEEGYFSCCEPWNDQIKSTVRWNGNEITNIGHDFDHLHWPIIQEDLRKNFYYATDLTNAVEYVIDLTAKQLGNKFWEYELDVADRDCSRYQEATEYWRSKSE